MKKEKITTWSFECQKRSQAKKWVEYLQNFQKDPSLNQLEDFKHMKL